MPQSGTMNLATGLCEDNEETRNLSVSTKSGRFLNLFSVVRWEILIGKEQFASSIPPIPNWTRLPDISHWGTGYTFRIMIGIEDLWVYSAFSYSSSSHRHKVAILDILYNWYGLAITLSYLSEEVGVVYLLVVPTFLLHIIIHIYGDQTRICSVKILFFKYYFITGFLIPIDSYRKFKKGLSAKLLPGNSTIIRRTISLTYCGVPLKSAKIMQTRPP